MVGSLWLGDENIFDYRLAVLGDRIICGLPQGRVDFLVRQLEQPDLVLETEGAGYF